MSISNVRLAVPQLQDSSTRKATAKDRPNYWNEHPSSLISTCDINDITFGTGYDVYRTSIIPAIERARTEVVLVTCFWARSATLHLLNEALCHLSARALQDGIKIKVRIGFSSSSLSQKLLHTSSLKGNIYKPETLQHELGLPDPELLEGLDLTVKSIFVLPLSVMHPKFVIIDRKQVFLPSCNVSWEDWFEGCVALRGDLVEQFILFWEEFWAEQTDYAGTQPQALSPSRASINVHGEPRLPELHGVPAIFLPSPHHVNPKFSAPWQECASPPPTPLNVYLLTLFAQASKSIHIQTPNLTSPPVLSALTSALERGIDVTILTSERLMVLEQLLTAGTTTSRCVQSLVRWHRKSLVTLSSPPPRFRDDLEAAIPAPVIGKLSISYYEPRTAGIREPGETEPVQSHLKLTIVDDEVAVLGSGNLDRASWFTSQELGVSFVSAEMVAMVKEQLLRAMAGRARSVYEG
nr:hypothetical protein CFP56_74632 [Quercus suber]